jgi:hypothetical protein
MSYQTLMPATIGHLCGLEEATANPRASPAPSPMAARVLDSLDPQVYEGFHDTGDQ